MVSLPRNSTALRLFPFYCFVLDYPFIALFFLFFPPALLTWMSSSVSPSHLLEFRLSQSISFQAALATVLPSLPTTCINLIGWNHTAETSHHPHSSLYKLHIATTGFLLDSWTLRMGSIGCPKMSVRNCHYLLCNNPEDCCSQLLHGGCLKSRMCSNSFKVSWPTKRRFTFIYIELMLVVHFILHFTCQQPKCSIFWSGWPLDWGIIEIRGCCDGD